MRVFNAAVMVFWYGYAVACGITTIWITREAWRNRRDPVGQSWAFAVLMFCAAAVCVFGFLQASLMLGFIRASR